MPTTTTSITGTAPPAGGLSGQAAQQNIAAAPNIDTLSQLISGINQQAYLSAPGRSQELATIQNQLSGNLDPSTVYQNQLRNAEQYGAGGFGADSQAWQTAIQRGLGIDRQNLISQGQQAMDKFYSGMPVVDASSQMASPGLLQQQQATQGAQALQAQQIANQASQFGQTLGQNQANLYASTYGTIPGYNEYGQYTGQTGTYPNAAQSAQGGTAAQYMQQLYGQGGAAGGAAANTSSQQFIMGKDSHGNPIQILNPAFVPGFGNWGNPEYYTPQYADLGNPVSAGSQALVNRQQSFIWA